MQEVVQIHLGKIFVVFILRYICYRFTALWYGTILKEYLKDCAHF